MFYIRKYIVTDKLGSEVGLGVSKGGFSLFSPEGWKNFRRGGKILEGVEKF